MTKKFKEIINDNASRRPTGEPVAITNGRFTKEIISSCSPGRLFGHLTFVDCIFNYVNFSLGDFYRCDFENCTFNNVTFDSCKFAECNFTNTEICNSSLFKALFNKSKLINCTLNCVNTGCSAIDDGSEIVDLTFSETFLNDVLVGRSKISSANKSIEIDSYRFLSEILEELNN
jgi:uncharacterized protein YjbI with pentapeptide repeats